MHIFEDRNGMGWHVEITVGTVKKLRALGIDIVSVDGKGLAGLVDDPVSLSDALWAICEAQANERGITDEEFFAAIDGNSVVSATDAITEAVIDFFPPSRRAIWRRAIEKGKMMETAMTETAMQKLEEMDLKSVLSLPELSE